MKIWMAMAVVAIGAGRCAAQDAMAQALRKGIVQEETQQNLAGAIQSYQAVLERFDEARKTAATALLRMAECYRKQGNTPQASAAYSRILREFADQTKIAEEARRHVQGAAVPATSEARARYRETLEAKVRLAEEQLHGAQKQMELGIVGPSNVAEFQIAVLRARRDVAAYDAGLLGPAQPAAGRAAEIAEARRQYAALLHSEIQIVSGMIEAQKKQAQLGTGSPKDELKLDLELLTLQSELAAFEAGRR